MSAPTKPTTEQSEQPTQPLPVTPPRGISGSLPAEGLPPANSLTPTASVWVVPATVVAAICAGLLIRVWLDTDQRFLLVVWLLVGLVVLSGGALLFSRGIDR